MKKLFSILITILLLILTYGILPKNIYAANPTLYFSPSSTTVSLNQTFAVSVMVNTNSNEVMGVTADFTYPTDKLELLSIDSSTSEFSIEAEQDYSSGTVYISRAVSGGSSYNGTGVVTVVNFKATASGTSTLTFTDDAVVTDASDEPTNILGTTQTATITCGSVPPTGIFDKPLLLAGIFLALALIAVGSMGIHQYIKDHKNKLNNSIQNNEESS